MQSPPPFPAKIRCKTPRDMPRLQSTHVSFPSFLTNQKKSSTLPEKLPVSSKLFEIKNNIQSINATKPNFKNEPFCIYFFRIIQSFKKLVTFYLIEPEAKCSLASKRGKRWCSNEISPMPMCSWKCWKCSTTPWENWQGIQKQKFGRWFSSSIGWFCGSMFIFQGVQSRTSPYTGR